MKRQINGDREMQKVERDGEMETQIDEETQRWI